MIHRARGFDRRWLVLIVACALSASCVKDAGVGPSAEAASSAGLFQLLDVNGTRLPATTAPRPPNACPGFTNFGTLLLTVDPQVYEARINTNFDCSNGSGPTFSDVERGTWAFTGDSSAPPTLAFSIAFTPTTAKVFNFATATVSGVTLTVRFDAPHQDAGNPVVAANSTWRKQ